MDNLQTRWLAADLDIKKLIKEQKPKDLANFFPESSEEFKFPGMSPERVLNIAKKHLTEYAFFGLMEKYQESLFLLSYTFGWKPIRDSAKLNVSPQETPESQVSKQAMKVVLNKTRIDAKLYSFGKKMFENRYSRMVNQLKRKYYKPSMSKLPPNELIFKLLQKNYEENYSKSPMKKSHPS